MVNFRIIAILVFIVSCKAQNNKYDIIDIHLPNEFKLIDKSNYRPSGEPFSSNDSIYKFNHGDAKIEVIKQYYDNKKDKISLDKKSELLEKDKNNFINYLIDKASDIKIIDSDFNGKMNSWSVYYEGNFFTGIENKKAIYKNFILKYYTDDYSLKVVYQSKESFNKEIIRTLNNQFRLDTK